MYFGSFQQLSFVNTGFPPSKVPIRRKLGSYDIPTHRFHGTTYAGAKYTTSCSDNFKSRISPQLFGNETPTGAISDNGGLLEIGKDALVLWLGLGGAGSVYTDCRRERVEGSVSVNSYSDTFTVKIQRLVSRVPPPDSRFRRGIRCSYNQRTSSVEMKSLRASEHSRGVVEK
jgi:hypothetical protein